jgi:hypothetical protein
MTADGSGFQQAKTADEGSRFLQIVAKPARTSRKRHKQPPKLTRVAFKVSRLMEFCNRRELQNQTGHHADDWPLVVLKELMDNALDACEEAEVAPVISITVKPGSIVIEDNGDGIKTGTIKSILDYSIRVSSREAYVSPTRGAQGNALKTILAMGYVLDRERRDGNAEARGVTLIESRGIRHHIEFRVDQSTTSRRSPTRPRRRRSGRGRGSRSNGRSSAKAAKRFWTMRKMTSKGSPRAILGSTRI